MSANCNRIWIFRSGGSDDDRREYLYPELQAGCLRIGWGGQGMALQDNEGRPIPKEQWEENYRRACGENPSPRRYSILRRLLEIKQGDVVGMPKMPNSGEFSIACVSGSYTFSVDRDDDYGHIIPVHSDSVRTFNHRADETPMRFRACFLVLLIGPP